MAKYSPMLTHVDRSRRHEKIVAAYQAGANSRVVAERFGINQSHVCYILRLYGVRKQPNANAKLTEVQAAEIRSATEQSRVLAIRYGVDRKSIWSIRAGRTYVSAS